MFKLIKVTILLTIFCRLSHQLPVNDTSETLSINDAYKDCAQVSRCFGLPDKCVDAHSCDVLLTVTPKSGGADFQLYWTRANTSSELSWAGAALSDDQNMGNDSVTECIVLQNQTVIARQGLTYGQQMPRAYGVNTVEPVKGVNNETGDYINGIVHCSWSRDADTMVETFDFNIMNNAYYIFLAVGPMNFTTGELMHHKNIMMSNEAVYLGQPISNATSSTTTSGNTTVTATVTVTESTNSTVTGTEGNSTTQASTIRSSTTSPQSTTPKSSGVTLLSKYFVSLISIFSVFALKRLF